MPKRNLLILRRYREDEGRAIWQFARMKGQNARWQIREGLLLKQERSGERRAWTDEGVTRLQRGFSGSEC